MTLVTEGNSGGGSGGGGTPSAPLNSIQYNNGGVFGGDSQALRDPTTHETFILNDVSASLDFSTSGNDFTVYAVNTGDVGNSIVLTADGVDDFDTIVATWNGANPGNPAIVTNGGTNIPDAGTYTLRGGGTVGYVGSNNLAPFGVEGAFNYYAENSSILNLVGVGNVDGGGSAGIMAAIDTGANTQAIGIFSSARGIRLLNTDNNTNYQATFALDQATGFFLQTNDNIAQSYISGSPTEINIGVAGYNYKRPTIDGSNGYVMTTDGAGTLSFTAGAAANNSWTVTLTDDFTAYAGNIIALKAEVSAPPYQAGAIYKTTTQSSFSTGSGITKVFTKPLKLNQKTEMAVCQDGSGITIQGMWYDVNVGQWFGQWYSAVITDSMDVSTENKWDVVRIDNNHFAVVYIDGSAGLHIAIGRMNGESPEIVDVYAVGGGETWTSVQATYSDNGAPYQTIAIAGWRSDLGEFVRGNVYLRADWTVYSFSDNGTGITTESDTSNFQLCGQEFVGNTYVLVVMPPTAQAHLIDSMGTIQDSLTIADIGTGRTKLCYLGSSSPSQFCWAYFTNHTTGEGTAGIISLDMSGPTLSYTTFGSSIFATDLTTILTLDAMSLTGFINYVDNQQRPSKIFAQRIISGNIQVVDMDIDYTPPVATITAAGTPYAFDPGFDASVNVVQSFNWRHENTSYRDMYLMDFVYINSTDQGMDRTIRVFDQDTQTRGDETRRKAVFTDANALFIATPSSTIGSTVTAYGPGARIPTSIASTLLYLDSDGLGCTPTISDLIALRSINDAESIVMLTPYQAPEIDLYGSATNIYSDVKMYYNAGGFSPIFGVPGYLSNTTTITNMANAYNQTISITNADNTGYTLSTNTGPGYFINFKDYMVIQPTEDIVDLGFNILEDGRTYFEYNIDQTSPRYYDVGTGTVHIPYFWKNYGNLYMTNCSGNPINFISVGNNINEGETKLLLSGLDSTNVYNFTAIGTPTDNAIHGATASTTLTGRSNNLGDWIEFKRINNKWLKTNIEIYI